MKRNIGIDIGRVIIGAVGSDGRVDTSFLSGGEEHAMRTPPSPGAFETIRALVAQNEGRVWLVSKCGKRIEDRSRRWLEHQDFFAKTGVSQDNLRFCKRRPDKAGHARDLALTHFIDDRVDVHRHLVDIVPNLYLFGVQDQPAPDWLTHVHDWDDVARLLTEPEAASLVALTRPAETR